MKEHTTIYSFARQMEPQTGETSGAVASLQEMQRTQEYAEVPY